MKKLFTLTLMLISGFAYAQPVIKDGSTIPTSGVSGDVYAGAGTPGSAGANQTWDFSSVTFTKIGTFEYQAASATPYAATFPDATNALSLSASGVSMYNLFKVSSMKMENVAGNWTASGGKDYTPDLQTILTFPMNYLDTYNDSYQKVGSSPDNVVGTYDGYGTLVLPFGTYNNVARVEYDYSGDKDYTWWQTNPLQILLIYNHSSGFTVINSNTTSVEKSAKLSSNVNVYPNPASGKAYVKVNAFTANTRMSLFNTLGQQVMELPVTSTQTEIDLNKLEKGVYFYQVNSSEKLQGIGKLVVE